MDKSAERTAFEEWADDGFALTLIWDEEAGQYCNPTIQAEWEAWNTAWLLSAIHQAKQPPATKQASQSHSLTLTARQMREALEFCNPDGPDDNDQMDDDVVIEWRDAFKDDEGNEYPAGYYAYMAEYPEEGFYGPLM